MARLTQAPMTPRRSVSNPDSLNDLNRLLARLQQSILQADAERERRLRTSEYERNKVGVNLEYARTVLTKLEQDALAVKVHTRRQELQIDLNHKREIFEQIAERLRELEEISIDSDDDSSEGEDLLEGIVHTPAESRDSRSIPDRTTEDMPGHDAEDGSEDDEPAAVPEPSRLTQASTTLSQSAQPTPTEQAATSTTQTLRSRTTQAAEPPPDAATTSARDQLFGSNPGKATTAVDRTATQEAILDHHRAEQDKLTESLLQMAQALKQGAHAFDAELEGEKDVLQSAGSGLERNERGMDAATRRMGALRKMTEGEGWWGRIMLWAWAYGLMVVLVLIMFVMPKLRW